MYLPAPNRLYASLWLLLMKLLHRHRLTRFILDNEALLKGRPAEEGRPIPGTGQARALSREAHAWVNDQQAAVERLLFDGPGGCRFCHTEKTSPASRLMKIVGGPDDDTPLAGSSPAGERRAKIDAWCAAHTVEEIVAALLDAGIPVAPVRTIPEVAKDPHLWAREMLVKKEDAVAGEMYLPGATVKLSKTPARVGTVPTPGQHTDEVLGRLLGYDRSALDALRAAGAIA